MVQCVNVYVPGKKHHIITVHIVSVNAETYNNSTNITPANTEYHISKHSIPLLMQKCHIIIVYCIC